MTENPTVLGRTQGRAEAGTAVLQGHVAGLRPGTDTRGEPAVMCVSAPRGPLGGRDGAVTEDRCGG